MSTFSNSLTLLKIHWVSTQILLLNETVPSIQDSAKYTWKEVTVMQWLLFGSSSLCFYLVNIVPYFLTVRLPWYSKLSELADINDFRVKSLVTDFCECQRRSEFGQCHSRRYKIFQFTGSTHLGENLGEIFFTKCARLLVKSKDSWWNGKTLGEIKIILVKCLESWWNGKSLGEIWFRQDKNYSRNMICIT